MSENIDAIEHNFIKPKMTDINSYEIMVRKRGVDDFAAYCPELNIIIKGKTNDEVKKRLKEYIVQYTDELKRGWAE